MSSDKLKTVTKEDDISPELQGTPIASLLSSHNLGVVMREYERPELLICTCMDYRIKLNIPARYTFIIRTPGANLLDSEFGLATAVALGGIRAVAIIGHTDCAMTKITDDPDKFVEGLSQSGWSRQSAKEYFESQAPTHSFTDPVQLIINQCQLLRRRYTEILFAPLIYDVEDGKLYQVME